MSNEEPDKEPAALNSNETRVSLLTAHAPAAIAVIELSGPRSAALIDECWMPAGSGLKVSVNSIRYGSWFASNVVSDHCHTKPASGLSNTEPMALATGIDSASLCPIAPAASTDGSGNAPAASTDSSGKVAFSPCQPAAEDIILCWTDEFTVEIHCHGGPVAAKRILADLTCRGAVYFDSHSIQSENETKRWTEEAKIDLELASTELTTAILLNQSRGALEDAFKELVSESCAGNDAVASELSSVLLARAKYGIRLLSGWRVAIVGPPNAGKSSLLNRILGYSRALVHSEAGTTRDLLVERTAILGWPITILDTAGLRQTDCEIESEGVKRAMRSLDETDLVLLLLEPHEGLLPLHYDVLKLHPMKTLLVMTKADLIDDQFNLESIQTQLQFSRPIQAISSTANLGIEDLYQAIIKQLIPEPVKLGVAVPFRMQQIDRIQKFFSASNRQLPASF